MARITALKLDVSKLESLGTRLGTLTGEAVGEVVVTTLNQVIDQTYELARDRMASGINLTDDYMRRKMRVDHATAAKPQASITANGTRGGPSGDPQTPLRNYGATQVFVPRVSKGKSRNRGLTGVPQGMKQRAVTVEVTRGGQVSLPFAFMLPLKRGNESGGNGLGVFARSKDGKMRHRYGPAVYQLFRFQLDRGNLVDDTTETLGDALAERAEAAFQKALQE